MNEEGKRLAVRSWKFLMYLIFSVCFIIEFKWNCKLVLGIFIGKWYSIVESLIRKFGLWNFRLWQLQEVDLCFAIEIQCFIYNFSIFTILRLCCLVVKWSSIWLAKSLKFCYLKSLNLRLSQCNIQRCLLFALK